MPYSEFQIKRHIEILDEKAIKEVEGPSDQGSAADMEKKKVRRPVVQEEPELTTLYMIVQTQEEVDQHNAKRNKEKISANDLKYEKESEEQQRIEMQNKENDK